MGRAKEKVIHFLNKIGIKAKEGIVPATSFIPNITINNGTIIYSDKTDVSDLLHEAGHLAIIPAKYREICQANMDKNIKKIWNKAKKNGEVEVDSLICRALIQASDTEATAWAWAGGIYLGISAKNIIKNEQYEGEGEDVRCMLSTKSYFGINGLRAAGMIESVKTYPKMMRWVQP